MSHAILSPSGASRWLSCTPSARLEQQFADTAGSAAAEGTLAHSLGELLIMHKTKRILAKDYKKQLADIQAHELYEKSMLDYCDDYATFVVEQFSKAQAHTADALLYLETKIDLTAYVPEGFGTGDVFIIADHVLNFTDLKYGKGVPVSAVENKQMMLYALGALHQFDYLYDIKEVHMIIYQPRLDNVSEYVMSVEDLKKWGEEELKPKALLAWNGEGEFQPGDACKFCRAKATCKALADYNLELARHEFADPRLLTPDDVADVLTRTKLFTDWLGAVNDYALAEAINNCAKWPGYKLVEGRSNRVYANEEKVANTLVEKGLHPWEIFNTKIKGITEIEKLLGKSDFATYLGALVVKPAGKPTLAPESDKRAEYSSHTAAADDFKDVLAELAEN